MDASEHALDYLRAGFSVIPARTDGSKRPALASWGCYQENRPDEPQVREWFENGPAAVAVLCGRISGGLEVLDFDDPDAYAAFWLENEGLAELAKRLPIVRTPRGGFHVYYRSEVVQGSQKLAMEDDRVLVETKGEGGYVLAPGSRDYRHVGGPSIAETPRITPPERETLLEAARGLDKRPRLPEKDGYDGAPSPPEPGRNLPGDDYNDLASWREILEPAGWVASTTRRPGVFNWTRPGKEPNEGTSATTGLESEHGNELFCVFSTNAAPFPGPSGRSPCSTHTKFDAYALIYHQGSHAAASRALAERGYGDPSFREGPLELDLRGLGEEKKVKTSKEPFRFEKITSAELDSASYEIEYLVERAVVAGQPGIIAGPKKSLKTSIAVDLAVSLSLGVDWLGHMKTHRAAKVGIFSGESGKQVLQETARRIAAKSGDVLGELGICWSTDLPKFERADHQRALIEWLMEDEIEVVIIDPAFLCMSGEGAENLFITGERLRILADVCKLAGATPWLIHHFRKTGTRPGQPGELEDIAWSGFAEFARQWILLSRREPFDPGSGAHRLWLATGGSAGHSGLWALDVDEGPDTAASGLRTWITSMCSAVTARKEDAEAKKIAREEKKRLERTREIGRLAKEIEVVLRASPGGETRSVLQRRVKCGAPKFYEALDLCLEELGSIEPCVVRKHTKSEPGFRIVSREPVQTDIFATK
jgi:putative DNA primase/helicase